MVSGKKCERFHEGSFCVALLLLYELVSCFIEDRNNFVLDLLELLEGVTEGGSNDIVREWCANFFKLNASF